MTPRPKLYDDQVCKNAAAVLAPKVVKWDQQSDGWFSLEEVTKSLADGMKHHSEDGYDFARFLESYHNYTPDSALVEILDEAWFLQREALKVLEKAWIEANQPPAPVVESQVVWKKDGSKGIVTRNEPSGHSVVCFPQKGHMRGAIGTQGIVIPWEDLEAAPVTETKAETKESQQ